MRPHPALLPLALLASCALGDQDAIFAGPVMPVRGECDSPSRATLTVRHRNIEFAPTSGVLVLLGALGPDGRIDAGLTRPGIDGKPFRLSLKARLAGSVIAGDYVTPRCRYTVRLTRTR